MKKILVIGAKGMAGHIVMQYLQETKSYAVSGIARQEGAHLHSLDVFETEKLKALLVSNRYDIVINCIGLLNKTAEDNPDQAVWFNSYFPHLLASWGKELGFKLIHISTDCVFSGKEGGYTEASFKNGIGFYAQSKALGEVVNDKDLTFRTSIIGPELKENGIGLFHWFMQQKEAVTGYKKAIWTGVTTLELAKAIHQAIDSDLTGLYHLVNNTPISKYDLLAVFIQHFKSSKIKLESNDSYHVDKSLVNTRTDFQHSVPSYDAMLGEMAGWMKDHDSLYKQYSV